MLKISEKTKFTTRLKKGRVRIDGNSGDKVNDSSNCSGNFNKKFIF